MLQKPTNTPQIEQPGQQPTQSGQQPTLMDERLKRKRGTGFTNISRILGANVGAGQRMGSKIGESLQAKAGEIRKGIEQGQSKFAAGKAEGSKEAQEAIGAAGTLARESFEQQGAFAGRSASDLAEQGKRLREAEYKGPEALEEAGKLQAKAATGAALAKLGGTSKGQSQLLASQVAQRGGYGKGMSEFDKMLLGREGQKQIQTGRGSLAGIETEAERAITGAESEAIAKQRGIEQERVAQIQDIRNRLYGEGTKESGGITGIKTQAEQQANKFAQDANRIKELISGSDKRGRIGTKENPLQPGDEKLLSMIPELGIENVEKIYAGDPTALQTTLNVLSRQITPDVGGSLFKESQKGAAQNLAAMLGGLQEAEQIRKIQNVNTQFKPMEGTYADQAAAREQAKKDIDATIRAANRINSVAGRSAGLFGQGVTGEGAEEAGIFGLSLDKENEIVERAINTLPAEQKRMVREMQAIPGMTAGRIGEFLSGAAVSGLRQNLASETDLLSTIRKRLGL